jgi:hypothetical protein
MVAIVLWAPFSRLPLQGCAGQQQHTHNVSCAAAVLATRAPPNESTKPILSSFF